MDISFHLLKKKDELVFIREIAASIWPETFAGILSPEQIRYMMNMMYAPSVMDREFDSGFVFVLVRVDGCNAGYIVCSPDHGVWKLHKLYLLSRYHSCGIGQKMLEHAAVLGRDRKFFAIRLNVNKQNIRAIRAYERNGFTTVESVKNPIGNGFYMDDYIMEKSLQILSD